MITLRKSTDRGYADHGWLKSFHSFSFADYYDPAHMGFGNLRVINEDRIAPGHRLRHARPPRHGDHQLRARRRARAQGQHRQRRDGIVPGDVQRMSAGTGVRHSEFNARAGRDDAFPADLDRAGRARHRARLRAEGTSTTRDKRGRLRLVARHDGRDGSVTMHADASMYAGLFDGDESAELALDPRSHAPTCTSCAARLEVNGQALRAGDALQLEGEAALVLRQRPRRRSARVRPSLDSPFLNLQTIQEICHDPPRPKTHSPLLGRTCSR